MRRDLLLLALIAICLYGAGTTQAVSPATTTAISTDSPEANAIRQKLLEWDRSFSQISLQDLRKTYHTENDREAVYFDWVAHEVWEDSKTEESVRDKWGAEIESRFAHLQNGTTREDDQHCAIKIDDDHATVSWDIKGIHLLPMIKVNGQWLVDGHAMFDQGLKDNPNMELQKFSSRKLMKQVMADIASDKFDDGESFIKDFQVKLQGPTNQN